MALALSMIPRQQEVIVRGWRGGGLCPPPATVFLNRHQVHYICRGGTAEGGREEGEEVMCRRGEREGGSSERYVAFIIP